MPARAALRAVRTLGGPRLPPLAHRLPALRAAAAPFPRADPPQLRRPKALLRHQRLRPRPRQRAGHYRNVCGKARGRAGFLSLNASVCLIIRLCQASARTGLVPHSCPFPNLQSRRADAALVTTGAERFARPCSTRCATDPLVPRPGKSTQSAATGSGSSSHPLLLGLTDVQDEKMGKLQ